MMESTLKGWGWLNGLRRTKPNKRLDRSGISLPVIENLNQFAVASRPVNRSVRLAEYRIS
jgi:hypothetical protein